MGFRLFTDATADMNLEGVRKFYDIGVLPMEVEVDGKTYMYGPRYDFTVGRFYELQRSGRYAKTSQVSPLTMHEFFEPVLAAGEDILYLCFSSGLSGTYYSACVVRDELMEMFPDRRVLVVDTLCASVGEGLFVREAVRVMTEQKLTMDELYDWAMKYRRNVCHWFTVDTFDHLRHGGRVSPAAATLGTVLNMKPMLIVDGNGKLLTMEKPRGRRQAQKAQLGHMKDSWRPELGKYVLIGHGDDQESADQLKALVLAEFPDAQVETTYIGPVIGAHTGPGMLALIFWGDFRQPADMRADRTESLF